MQAHWGTSSGQLSYNQLNQCTAAGFCCNMIMSNNDGNSFFAERTGVQVPNIVLLDLSQLFCLFEGSPELVGCAK